MKEIEIEKEKEKVIQGERVKPKGHEAQREHEVRKEQSNAKGSGRYPFAYDGEDISSAKDCVREAYAVYSTQAYARQGEYTLEDYYALPDDRRVELIDGFFYDMAAPGLPHQIMAAQIFRQLDDYIDAHGGSCIPFMSPVDVQLDRDDRTMVQPDVAVLCDMQKAKDNCICGAPDFVAEVLSVSTLWKDQTIKLKKYQEAGVREYWMIDLRQEKVITYDFAHGVHPAIYGMDVPVPVQIYDGKCQICFDTFYARMRKLQADKKEDLNKQKNADEFHEAFSTYERESCLSGDDCVREAEAAYAAYVAQPFTRQGEYTLEDYYALPDDRRVELIDGIFYDMASLSSAHQIATLDISMQLASFIKSRNGFCRTLSAPMDVQLDCDDRTMVQPDVLVVCDREKIRNRCIYGAPDLVIEILSASTAYKDMTVKRRKYGNAGVREYWIVDLRQERVIVYDMTEENRRKAVIRDSHSKSLHDGQTYTMDHPVPVQIFDGECRIDFKEICEEVRAVRI